MKNRLFLIVLIFLSIFASALGQNRILNTKNTKSVCIQINDAVVEQWGLSTEKKLDVYEIFNLEQLKKKVCFFSDIDTICFLVQQDTIITFDIVYDQLIKYPTAISVKTTMSLPNTITTEEKVYFLSYFWSEVKYNFVFIDELKFDLDSLYKSKISEVMATKNDYEYYQVLKKFAASLKDGHTNIFENSQFYRYRDYVPFEGNFINQDFYITRVRKPYDKILPVGSKVIEIDNLPFERYLEAKIYPFINSKSPSTVKFLAENALFSSDLTTDSLCLKYITPKKEIKTHIFARDGEKTRTSEDVYCGRIVSYPIKPLSLSWEKDDIAVLAINSFLPEIDESQMDKLFDEASKAKGLIIDLRFNGGGSTDHAFRLLSRIAKNDYFLTYGYQSRINNGVKRANGNWIEEFKDFYTDQAYETQLPDTIFIPDSIQKFNMPIIVLISENTASAAEDFLIMMYEMKDRPTIIGKPSFGSTGSPLVIASGMVGEDFPGGGYGRICTRRVLFPYSLTPFNTSIMPDIEVNYNTIEEFLRGKDKVLDTALKIMIKK